MNEIKEMNEQEIELVSGADGYSLPPPPYEDPLLKPPYDDVWNIA